MALFDEVYNMAGQQRALQKGATTNKYLPGSMQSETDYKNAQTGLTNQQSKFLPLKYLIEAQQASQTGSRFGGAYQMARALQAMAPAARELWIAQNQDKYNDMLAGLGSKEGSTSFITPDMINKFIPGAVPTGGNNGGLSGNAGGAPAAASPNGFVPSTPEQVEQIKLANKMAANKSLTTNATERQMEGAIQVESIVNDPGLQARATDAAKFVGILGKVRGGLAAASQQNPKEYENYLSFKNQDMVLLLNRIKTLDGMGATDAQRDELNGLYNRTMNALASNSPQFITQFNNLGKSLDRVAKAVQKSASPVAGVNRVEGFNPIDTSMVSVIDPKGARGKVPANQLKAALKAGYKQVQ